MSEKQKSIRIQGHTEAEGILDELDDLNKVEWDNFWGECDIDTDLDNARSDLRDAYQMFD